MPTEHDDFVDLLPAYLDGDIDAPARQRLEQHVAVCSACGRELEGARRLQRIASEWSEPLPVGFTQQLTARLDPPRPRLPWAWAAAAASLLVAAGLSYHPAAPMPAQVATLVYGGDSILVKLPGGHWSAVGTVTALPAGTEIKTAAESPAVLQAADTSLRLDSDTWVRIEGDQLWLGTGRLQLRERTPRLRIETDTVTLQGLGTIYDVATTRDGPTTVKVLEGLVQAGPNQTVPAGNQGDIDLHGSVVVVPAPGPDAWDVWNTRLRLPEAPPASGPLPAVPLAPAPASSAAPAASSPPSEPAHVSPSRPVVAASAPARKPSLVSHPAVPPPDPSEPAVRLPLVTVPSPVPVEAPPPEPPSPTAPATTSSPVERSPSPTAECPPAQPPPPPNGEVCGPPPPSPPPPPPDGPPPGGPPPRGRGR